VGTEHGLVESLPAYNNGFCFNAACWVLSVACKLFVTLKHRMRLPFYWTRGAWAEGFSWLDIRRRSCNCKGLLVELTIEVKNLLGWVR